MHYEVGKNIVLRTYILFILQSLLSIVLEFLILVKNSSGQLRKKSIQKKSFLYFFNITCNFERTNLQIEKLEPVGLDYYRYITFFIKIIKL